MITEGEVGVPKKLDSQLGGLVMFNISHIAHLFAKRGNRELIKSGFKLQLEQLPILFVVNASTAGLFSQQEIADLLLRDKSGIQRSIRTLERDGYLRVIADSSDRRKNLVQMTPAGKLVIEKILAFVRQQDDLITNQLAPEEVTVLSKVLNKITQLLEA